MDQKYQIINMDKISQEYENDKETILEIVKVFLQYLPEQLELLTNAINEKNGKLISQYAHKLKGSVGNFYVDKIIAQLMDLEKMGKIYSIDMHPKGLKMVERVREDLIILENDLKMYQQDK